MEKKQTNNSDVSKLKFSLPFSGPRPFPASGSFPVSQVFTSGGQSTGASAPVLLPLLSRFSPVRLSATPWTAAHQAPPSMGFSRQEYWSGVPLPSPSISERIPKGKKSTALGQVLVTPWVMCITT